MMNGPSSRNASGRNGGGGGGGAVTQSSLRRTISSGTNSSDSRNNSNSSSRTTKTHWIRRKPPIGVFVQECIQMRQHVDSSRERMNVAKRRFNSALEHLDESVDFRNWRKVETAVDKVDHVLGSFNRTLDEFEKSVELEKYACDTSRFKYD